MAKNKTHQENENKYEEFQSNFIFSNLILSTKKMSCSKKISL